MCGIHLHVSKSAHTELDSQEADFLARRGPDAIWTHKVAISDNTKWYLTFTSSVLSLRGNAIQIQPVVDEDSGSVFCWNGEAWCFDDALISVNDTQAISRSLFATIKHSTASEDDVLDVFNRISGPYAFVFYNAVSKIIYFGRDLLGRRSLLLDDSRLEDGELTVASIMPITPTALVHETNTTSFTAIDLTKNILMLRLAGSRPPLPKINQTVPPMSNAIRTIPSQEAILNLISQLRASVEVRIKDVPTYTPFSHHAEPSRVAVLFSGGVDCTLLARLAHDILPHDQPVDLLNVAFENPRVINARKTGKNGTIDTTSNVNSYETCPDRITGRSSFEELKSVCHERLWRFMAIDVSYHEYIQHRPTIICLMKPHNTEMDLSITSALYFAAKGEGVATLPTDMQEQQQHTTTARVLLSGLGADELFGGYARHAAAFSRNGYSSLIEELGMDFARIGTRNLGRDDRVIAHWGRETRYPFLDENFVRFALSLPVWEKCGFRHGVHVAKHFENTGPTTKIEELHPEKMLLRCATWRLGMPRTAAEKKRAIQFGARTAKMHLGSSKGTDLVTASLPPTP